MTYVRDDDNEYDVLYEDGTTFTIPAKDVRKQTKLAAASARKKTPSRSRSRGRSPGRKPKASPARSPKSPASPAKPRASRAAATTKAPRPDPTPVRTSARLAKAKVELSDDEDGAGGRKAIPNPAHPRGKSRKGFFADLNLDWLQALFFIVLGPAILVSLHTLARAGVYQLKWPELSRKPADYWDRNSFVASLVFLMGIRFLNLLPLGSTVRSCSGVEVRMNGIHTLLTVLSVIPALVYRKVDVSFVAKNYFHLMTSSIILSFALSLIAYILVR